MSTNEERDLHRAAGNIRQAISELDKTMQELGAGNRYKLACQATERLDSALKFVFALMEDGMREYVTIDELEDGDLAYHVGLGAVVMLREFSPQTGKREPWLAHHCKIEEFSAGEGLDIPILIIED